MSERIAGINSVFEVLKQRPREIEKISIAREIKNSRLQQIKQIAIENKVQFEFVPRQVLDRIETNVPHQGVIAFVSAIRYSKLDELLKKVRSPGLLIMLDGIEDPRNLGAIVRTADAVSADGVIIPERRSASVTSATHKASAGSVENVPIARVKNLARSIETLKSAGFWIIGAGDKAEQNYTDADLTGPICVVFGNENKGIRKLIAENCDLRVSIPILGKVSSLNVSVAAGVLLYEAIRQRSH